MLVEQLEQVLLTPCLFVGVTKKTLLSGNLNTNTAGSLRLSAGTQIVGGLRSRQEILIWTDDALYSMQFIGPPYTFGVNLINQGVGMVSPKAAVNAPPGVFGWIVRAFTDIAERSKDFLVVCTAMCLMTLTKTSLSKRLAI